CSCAACSKLGSVRDLDMRRFEHKSPTLARSRGYSDRAAEDANRGAIAQGPRKRDCVRRTDRDVASTASAARAAIDLRSITHAQRTGRNRNSSRITARPGTELIADCLCEDPTGMDI